MSTNSERVDGDGVTTMAAPKPSRAAGGRAAAGNRQLDVILDIDLPLVVRFGHTEMTVEALTRVGEGSVIDLGRSPHEPVDLLVSGRLVARGEVVVVSGHYGVRVIELVSGGELQPAMEA